MSHKKRLNILERQVLRAIWRCMLYVAGLSHKQQFLRVAPIIRFILYRVLFYRVGTVRRNLRRSFPQMHHLERRRIRDNYYTYLSEAIVGTMALARNDSYNILFDDDPHSPHNHQAQLLRESVGGRSWIALTAHFGLWEYLLYWAQFSDQKLLGVYHPLSNRIFDTLFEHLRHKSRVRALASHDIGRFMMTHGRQHNGESYTLGLIADQNPPLLKLNNWYDFLNQPTIFFEGGERFARRFGLPIYFVYQQRVGAGRYRLCAKPLWDGEEGVDSPELTRRYVRMLHDCIVDDPSLWLWSHRRWKHRRTATNSTTPEPIH